MIAQRGTVSYSQFSGNVSRLAYFVAHNRNYLSEVLLTWFWRNNAYH